MILLRRLVEAKQVNHVRLRLSWVLAAPEAENVPGDLRRTPDEELVAFRQHCTRSATEGIHMRNGPGFICLSVAVCLKGLSVLMHLWLRVPDVSDDDGKAPRDDEESKTRDEEGGQGEATK